MSSRSEAALSAELLLSRLLEPVSTGRVSMRPFWRSIP